VTDKPVLLPWSEISDAMMGLEWTSNTTGVHLVRFRKRISQWRSQPTEDIADLELAIRSLAVHRAVIILLDDAHRFDESSLRLTLDLARSLNGERVLIVAAYDTDDLERGETFEQTLSALRGEALTSDLPLNNLSSEHLRNLIERKLEMPVHRDLLEYLFDSSKGMPMHALETLALMKERKMLVERNGIIQRDRTSILDVPPVLLDLAERRLEWMARDQQRLLEFHAMMGPQSDLESLAVLTGLKLDKVLSIFKEMNGNGGLLVNERRFAFRHPVFEQAMLRGISSLRSKEMHRAIADLLARKGLGEHYPESLANHHLLGEAGPEGQYHLHMAVEKCMAFSAHQKAREYLGKMMENVECCSAVERAWILENLGDCNMSLNSCTQAHLWYGRFLNMVHDGQERARVLLKQARCLRSISQAPKDRDQRIALMDEIMGLGPSDCDVLGGAWVEKGRLLREEGLNDDAFLAFEEANRRFEAAGHWHLMAESLLEQIDVCLRTNDLERAYFLLMHTEELLDPERDRKLSLALEVTFGDLFMMEGYYECSIRRYHECMMKARQMGDYATATWCAFCQSLMLLDMTEFAAAGEMAQTCEEQARLCDDEERMILPKALRVLIDVVLERVDQAGERMKALIARRKALPCPPMDISDGFVDLVDGILRYRHGSQSDGDVAFGLGMLGLEGKRMGSFFQGLGKEWFGSMLMETGNKNKAKEQFQMAYSIFLHLGNKTHSDRVVSHMYGLERGWLLEQMAT